MQLLGNLQCIVLTRRLWICTIYKGHWQSREWLRRHLPYVTVLQGICEIVFVKYGRIRPHHWCCQPVSPPTKTRCYWRENNVDEELPPIAVRHLCLTASLKQIGRLQTWLLLTMTPGIDSYLVNYTISASILSQCLAHVLIRRTVKSSGVTKFMLAKLSQISYVLYSSLFYHFAINGALWWQVTLRTETLFLNIFCHQSFSAHMEIRF